MQNLHPRVSLSQEIKHRDDFPLLAMWRRLETIVEVGVERGVFSEMFLSRAWGLRHYIGLDPYRQYDEFPGMRAGDLQIAAQRYARFPCASLMQIHDAVIAQSIADGELGHIKEHRVDMVYIDAEHTYQAVRDGLIRWWPLISDHGIMAGHDYDETHPGVMQAVNEFADRHNVCVYLTREHPNSWYIYKLGCRPDTAIRC